MNNHNDRHDKYSQIREAEIAEMYRKIAYDDFFIEPQPKYYFVDKAICKYYSPDPKHPTVIDLPEVKRRNFTYGRIIRPYITLLKWNDMCATMNSLGKLCPNITLVLQWNDALTVADLKIIKPVRICQGGRDDRNDPNDWQTYVEFDLYKMKKFNIDASYLSV